MCHDYSKEAITFSVIVPCYNSGKTIVKCIDSIIGQTVQPFEILIYDDASTDSSQVILKDYSDQHEFIRVIYGDTNSGAGFARNELLKICSGTFIAFLDADDYWLPNKLELQRKTIINSHTDVVGCKIRLLSPDHKTLGFRTGTKDLTFKKLLSFNYIGMSGVVVSSKLKGAREMPLIRKRQDYAYFLNLFYENPNIRFDFCREELVHYIRSPKSLSGESKIDKVKFNFFVLERYGRLTKLESTFYLLLHILNRLRAD